MLTKKFFIRPFAITVIVFLLTAICMAAIQNDAGNGAVLSAAKKTVTIVDERGKRIEIPQPLQRVCCFNIWNAELVRAVGGWKSIVGMDLNTAQDQSYWPGFNMNNIVGPNQRQPNYEKLVALKPQLVFFPSNGAWAEAEEKLAPFGIKVVVFTAWDPSMFAPGVANLGLMFNKKNRAKALLDFYQKHLDLVQAKVKNLEKKKRVYYESYGIQYDYKTCLVGSGWHDMIQLAGGINIFGDINIAEQPKSKGTNSDFEVDPEAILVRNPQVVLKMDPGQKAIPGSTIFSPPEPGELKGTWKRLIGRPGWSQLDAVKNNRLYVWQPFIGSTCTKMVGVCYLAKMLYPELFPELDPEAIMKEWIEKYQGLKYQGGYVYIPPKTES